MSRLESALPLLQVIAQLELWNERKSGRYEKKVYVVPKHLDEKVRHGRRRPLHNPDNALYCRVLWRKGVLCILQAGRWS